MKPSFRPWTRDAILSLARGYQVAAILDAAAELTVFDACSGKPRGAAELARRLSCDPRGLTVLLDALASLHLLVKRGKAYSLSPGLAPLLTTTGEHSLLAMAQHQAHCLRRWAELAAVVKNGRPARVKPGVRGVSGQRQAFIGAMDDVSAPIAQWVIRAIHPIRFNHLLDIGGASGTWTIAFLRACPLGRATLFDLPPVIPLARRHLAEARLASRVGLVPGDFLKDPLPTGPDFAWVSAIVHQNSRPQNRALFRKVYQALSPAGRIAIRDVVMDPSRTAPLAGALFAVNMLTATRGGGTFTLRELEEDLAQAGFRRVTLVQRDEGMNSLVLATKPAN